MRRTLLASTIIAGAALSATAAQAAEPIKIKIGGFYRSVFTITDQNSFGSGDKFRKTAVEQDAEIHFKGETTLDNGLTIGVRVELEAFTTGDQIDEHYIYLKGGWGQVIIGADDGAAEKMHLEVKSVVPGHGVDDATYLHHRTRGRANESTEFEETGDANKIIYRTPKLGGIIQGAVSYTPEIGSGRGGFGRTFGVIAKNAAVEDVLEGGLRLTFDPSDMFGIDISGTAITGDAPAGQKDLKGFNVGTHITVGNLVLMGAYKDLTADRRGEKGTIWAGGALYKAGNWGFSAGYLGSKTRRGSGNDDYEAYGVGSSYKLGPGITSAAFVQHHESNRATSRKSKSTTGGVVLLLGF